MNKRKRRVADIALKLFVEKGIQQTSIQEIIEKANISKGTFYNYFSSKNDCIAAILENLRYDSSQQRMAIQFGKDIHDRKVFIEQIASIIRLNQEHNLSALFEAILSSNETELKKLVMQHRIFEMDWLSNRMIEVMGEKYRDYVFEVTILFYGMFQQMLFSLRITGSTYSLPYLVEVILSYAELILKDMKQKGTSLITASAVDLLKSKVSKKMVTLDELKKLAGELKKHHPFNEEQNDLYEAIVSELDRNRIRKSVLQPLLKPFHHSFKESEVEAQVCHFTNMAWDFLRTI